MSGSFCSWSMSIFNHTCTISGIETGCFFDDDVGTICSWVFCNNTAHFWWKNCLDISSNVSRLRTFSSRVYGNNTGYLGLEVRTISCRFCGSTLLIRCQGSLQLKNILFQPHQDKIESRLRQCPAVNRNPTWFCAPNLTKLKTWRWKLDLKKCRVATYQM